MEVLMPLRAFIDSDNTLFEAQAAVTRLES